jgi:hypothetical protein
MEATKIMYRKNDDNNKKSLRHDIGSGKVQVCCASQEKYGITEGSCWFQRCMQVEGSTMEGMDLCMSV